MLAAPATILSAAVTILTAMVLFFTMGVVGRTRGKHKIFPPAMVGHPEVAAAVRDELVQLLEGAGIEQQFDALAGGQLAGRVLAFETIRAAAELGAAFQVLEYVVVIHAGFRLSALGFGLQAFGRQTFAA